MHQFCHFCGTSYEQTQDYPRKCSSCSKEVWRNPIPVAVILIPIGNGLLGIRRNVEPYIGSIALPGGYINYGESWEAACARECFEETGFGVNPEQISHVKTVSAPDSTLLIFGLHPKLPENILQTFVHNNETTEVVIIQESDTLAFPIHQEIAKNWFLNLRQP